MHCPRSGVETLAKHTDGLGSCLRRMLKTKDRHVVIVALAVRLAHVAWALQTSGRRFTAQPRPAPSD